MVKPDPKKPEIIKMVKPDPGKCPRYYYCAGIYLKTGESVMENSICVNTMQIRGKYAKGRSHVP